MKFKRMLVTIFLGMFIFSIAACHTVEGAGKDIEQGGEAVQDAAD